MLRNLHYTLQRFMYGRNGADTLSWALILAGAVLCVLAWLLKLNILSAVAYIPLLAAIFRMYSRNLERRHYENMRFCSIIPHLRDRTHRYYYCAACCQTMRVPRGKGKIRIRCPKCGREIIRRT